MSLTAVLVQPRPALAQAAAARLLITMPVNNGQLVRLAGNTRPEANARNDRGRVPDSLPMQHMQLLLKRPAEREAALRAYLQQLYDRRSPNFHRWLNSAQFALRFGLAPQDRLTITAWLRQQGFTVDSTAERMTIDFSGTAGQVRQAFHTEIHRLQVRGRARIANMSDPQIPAALAPAVAGVVSLNDFRPHPLYKPRAAYTTSSGKHLIAPADLATIYHLGPLFGAGYSGQGESVVVIEDTNVYSTSDWSTFRSTFGLSSYTSGSLTQKHPAPPSGSNNCANPGTVADNEHEAQLDVEWASAAAPNAAIVLASCADTTTTFGGLIALQNLIDSSSPPAIVSISYGECEAQNGATANAAYADVYEEAAALGTSVFVAAGDDGAVSCDADTAQATHGIGVNAFASTPYDVAVGGTDFGDTYAGTTSSYWSSSNGAYYGSALSYVPEIPWNNSCASALIAGYEGYSATYGSSGFCNSTTGKSGFLSTVSGSGGPSACATGSASTTGVVGGSCAGYAKPSWQSGVSGIPGDGVRDLPDVSLFAGNGVWGHYYVYCDSDIADDGASCDGAPSGWSGAGGTSFGAPILAGIQALVNQYTGSTQGNPNYVYYALAAGQIGNSSLSCTSSEGNATSSGCVFYDVTTGDMDVDCQGSYDCYLPSGSYGVLSTSDSSYTMAYGAGAGWDFATGLGTINAANLAQYWNAADLILSSSGSVTSAGLLSYTLTLDNAGPQTATDVVVTTTLPAGYTLMTSSSSSACTQSGTLVSCAIGALADGADDTLTVVIEPASTSVSLTFAATSANPDINPGAGVSEAALAAPDVDTDGPLPTWSYVLLGLALMAGGAAAARRCTSI